MFDKTIARIKYLKEYNIKPNCNENLVSPYFSETETKETFKLRCKKYTLCQLPKTLNDFITEGLKNFALKAKLPKKTIYKYSGGLDYIRELIRTRDNHKCRICLKQWNCGQRKFDVHHFDKHIGKISKCKLDRKNTQSMITLCHSCHLKLEHKKFV